MRRLVEIARTILVVFLFAILLMNVWLAGAKLILHQDMPKLFGYSHAIVLSGSMEPYFLAGDVVIFKMQDDYSVGDVVAFPRENIFVTHRVVGMEQGKFITKGDANNVVDDEKLDPRTIEGKVVGVIPNMGHVMQFVRTPAGILFIIVVGLALMELSHVLKKIKKRQVT